MIKGDPIYYPPSSDGKGGLGPLRPPVRRAAPKLQLRLGTGQRFATLSATLARRPGVRDPDALAAAIGRRKLGAKRFNDLAAAAARKR